MVLANRENDKAKSRVLRRFLDQNRREIGLAYRQLQQNGGQTLVHKDNANMCVLEFNNFLLYITEVLDLSVIEYTLSSARSTGIPPCQYALTREAATRSRY